MHTKRTHQNTNEFKCTFDGCEFVTKHKSSIKFDYKRIHLKLKKKKKKPNNSLYSLQIQYLANQIHVS